MTGTVTAFVLASLLTVGQAAAPAQAPAAAASDRDQVLAAVQGFFDAMARRDPDLARRVMMPEGQFITTTDPPGANGPRASSFKGFIDGLAGGTGALLERMWNPDVKIAGAIAVVTTPYDFHRDGKFTHCGTDIFTLVKMADGWKISGGSYTVQRTDCAPSPLGPVK